MFPYYRYVLVSAAISICEGCKGVQPRAERFRWRDMGVLVSRGDTPVARCRHGAYEVTEERARP